MDKTASFPTTCWTQIRQAGTADENAQTEAKRAMNSICSRYWHPVYTYARRRGWNHNEAEDETQIFFQNIINGDLLRKADPEQGKLRTLFLTVFQRQLATALEHKGAQKRGGNVEHLSLNFEGAADRFDEEDLGSDERSPEAAFDRAWAMATIDLCLERVGHGLKPEQQREFELLKPFLQINPKSEPDRAAIATELNISEAGVRKKIERLRKSMGKTIREQIAESLLDPTSEKVNEEIQALRQALGG